jgi:hypothetical protein
MGDQHRNLDLPQQRKKFLQRAIRVANREHGRRCSVHVQVLNRSELVTPE